MHDLDFAGRVLSAANAELPVSGEPLTRLWQATTLLREHRGDSHFAALAAADIDGCEAVVLRCAKDIPRVIATGRPREPGPPSGLGRLLVVSGYAATTAYESDDMRFRGVAA